MVYVDFTLDRFGRKRLRNSVVEEKDMLHVGLFSARFGQWMDETTCLAVTHEKPAATLRGGS